MSLGRLKTLEFFMVLMAVWYTTSCTNLVFVPMKKHVLSPKQINLEYEDWYIPVDRETKLHAWYLPAKKPQGSVLFVHGNSQNISTHIASVFWLPEAGYNVLLYDYRGFGKSNGVSTLENAVEDFPLVLRRLHEKDPSSRRRLIVFGQSLGGAITLNGLTRKSKEITVDAVIVDSSFTGFRRIARQKLREVWFTWPFQWPLSFTFTRRYAPVEEITKLSATPIVIIHGTGDRVVPFRHGEVLFSAANEPKEFWRVEGGKHIEFVVKPENRQRLIDYFSRLNSHRLDKIH